MKWITIARDQLTLFLCILWHPVITKTTLCKSHNEITSSASAAGLEYLLLYTYTHLMKIILRMSTEWCHVNSYLLTNICCRSGMMSSQFSPVMSEQHEEE